jgi:hypothetical protein
MDDLSLEATKLVIEYCLEILDEVEGTISGKATLARLQTALKLQYAEQYENGSVSDRCKRLLRIHLTFNVRGHWD